MYNEKRTSESSHQGVAVLQCCGIQSLNISAVDRRYPNFRFILYQVSFFHHELGILAYLAEIFLLLTLNLLPVALDHVIMPHLKIITR
jgi:hypothetical protein